MNRTLSTGLVALTAITLTACGGGGGGGTTIDREAAPGGASGIVDSALVRFTALNTAFDNVNPTNTPVQSDLPDSGIANFSGSAGFDMSGAVPGGGNEIDSSIVGDLNVAVNFAGTNNISGSISNMLFADTDGNIDNVDGSLTLTGGIISVPQNNGGSIDGVISADAVGPVVIEQAGTANNVTLTLDMSGQFGGTPGAPAGSVPITMRGFIVGDVEEALVGGQGDMTLRIPNGRFAAETAGAGIINP